MPLDFSNTEVAFAGRSDQNLRKARFLFQVLAKQWMVKLGKRFTVPALRIGLPIKGIIKSTLFSQFVGGETIEECEKTIQQLSAYGIGTILDYSVEGLQEEAYFDSACTEILRTIEKANGNPDIPFSVFKVTGLGSQSILEKVSRNKKLSEAETAEWERVVNRVNRICKAAWKADTPVLVDAEESWIQDAIDALAMQMMEQYNQQSPIVFNTLQMYRHDRLAYLKSIWKAYENTAIFPAFKIVRGAYMEKERERAQAMGYPSPIQPDKAATDADFDAAVEFCLNHIERIAICAGTHNENSSRLLAEKMRARGLDIHHPHIYFAQLLGMSDHISYNLAKLGYRVAKYVPYGPVKEVLPYLIRRAEENTSVAGQTGRELSLLLQELRRRKSQRKS